MNATKRSLPPCIRRWTDVTIHQCQHNLDHRGPCTCPCGAVYNTRSAA